MSSIRDSLITASVEAVMNHHRDLTSGEAATLAGISELQAVQSLRHLADLRIIEPREPRRCGRFGKKMAAYILAARSEQQ